MYHDMYHSRKFKGLVCMVMVFALLGGAAPQHVSAIQQDTARAHWAQEHINSLYAYHVLSAADAQTGPNTPVKPDDFDRWLYGIFRQASETQDITDISLTRLDAAMLVARAFYLSDGDPITLLRFPDYYLVPEDKRPSMAALVEAGIIRGHGAGQNVGYLDPLGTVTHAQAASLLAVTAGRIFFEPGLHAGIVLPGNGVINSGGVVLHDAEVHGNLIITGEGEVISIEGRFYHVIVKTTSPVRISGFVEHVTILADSALVEIMDGEINMLHIIGNNSQISGTGQVHDINLGDPGMSFAKDVAEPADAAANREPTPTPGSRVTPPPVINTPAPQEPPQDTPGQIPGATPAPSPTPTSDPSPSPTPTPDPSPSPTPTPDPSPTPSSEPSPSPTPTPEPSPSPTPTPDPSPSPSPTPDPSPTPTPSPTPIPVPTPPSSGGSFEIPIPGDTPLIIAPGNPLFNILNQLCPGNDHLIIENREITAAIIDNRAASFSGAGLTNPANPLEMRLTPSASLSLGGLQGDLSNLVIVGSGNNIALQPNTAPITAISLQGNLNLDATAIVGSLNTITFNLIGSANLTIPTASNFLPIYLNLSGLTGSAQIVSHGVTISAAGAVNYYVGLMNASNFFDGERLHLSFANVPDGTWMLYRNILAGSTVQLWPNHAIINGQEVTIP